MANLIREARRAKKMTQDELAKRLEHDYDLKINRATLSKYESGKIDPPVKHLKKIAAALSLTSWTDLVPEEIHGSAIAADIIDRAGLTLVPAKESEPHVSIDKNSEEYMLGFKAGLMDFASVRNGQKPSRPDLMDAQKNIYLTDTDNELLNLGGFDALAAFYLLPEDVQKIAIKDIRAFIEFTVAKYQAQKPPETTEEKE